MEYYNVYQDYFNLASQIVKYMQRNEGSPDAGNVLRADSALMQCETFHSIKGKLPFMDFFDHEESNSDMAKDQCPCPLPYPKNWNSSPTLQKDKSSVENLQDQGAVGKGQANPQRPAHLDEKVCILCKSNCESKRLYTSHQLKDSRGKVTCPVLRKQVCPACGATGDHAHSLRLCPVKNAAKNAYARQRATGYHRQYPINDRYNPRYFYY